MTKDEWRELVKGIYHDSIEPKLSRYRRHLHPMEWFEKYPYGRRNLTSALRVLRFIDTHFEEDDDLTEAFNPGFLKSTLDDLESGLSVNERLVVETGVADCIQEFFDEIASGMEVGDIPDEDFEALRASGSQDPRAECQLSILRIKHKKEKIVHAAKEVSFSLTIKDARKRVSSRKARIEKPASNEARTKRIFKGLVNIGRGAILAVVDATVVAGMWPVILAPETRTVGAVVSMTMGIADILTGVVELRPE